MTVTVVIEGVPLAKGRPRYGNGHMYTPKSTADFERSVGWSCKAAMKGQRPFAGPVKINIQFELPAPKSWLKPKRNGVADTRHFATCRPDIDNLTKTVLDACNGVIVLDDSQIIELVAAKRFSAEPKLTLAVVPYPTKAGDGIKKLSALLFLSSSYPHCPQGRFR